MSALGFVCHCGKRSISELARWEQYYVSGESWSETCEHCGARYTVELKTSREDLPGA